MTKAHPFIKWVGGKTQLLPELHSHMPFTFKAYHEPFLGGGALFFATPLSVPARLSDVNSDLVKTYRIVKNRLKDLILILQELAKGHGERQYYEIRERFNRNKGLGVETAAWFI